jgi:hypothetical protein
MGYKKYGAAAPIGVETNPVCPETDIPISLVTFIMIDSLQQSDQGRAID